MTLAPLHGRSSPLVLTRKEPTNWPRYSPSELKRAPLSTRARNERRRRRTRIGAWFVICVLGLAATIGFVFWLRG